MPTNKQPNASSGTGTIPKSNLSARSDQNLNDNSNYVQVQESSPHNITRISNNDDNNRAKQQRTNMPINLNGRQSTPSIEGNLAQNGDNTENSNHHNGNSIQKRYL